MVRWRVAVDAPDAPRPARRLVGNIKQTSHIRDGADLPINTSFCAFTVFGAPRSRRNDEESEVPVRPGQSQAPSGPASRRRERKVIDLNTKAA